MARTRRRPRGDDDAEDFPLAPLIDLVFLLLVFFMCVSSQAAAERRIAVDLPAARRAETPGPDAAAPLRVSLPAAGSWHVGAEPVAADHLARRLGELVAANRAAPVALRVGADVPFRETRRALEAAAEAGAATVGFGVVLDPAAGGTP